MATSPEIARAVRARFRPGNVPGAARAYLAGFGTSGCLLAGAALMFIVASALVGFRGWPHVGAQPSPGTVVVSPRPTAATSSPSAHRLALISSTPTRPAPGSPAAIVPGGGGAGGAPDTPAPRALHSIGTPASTPPSRGANPTSPGASSPSVPAPASTPPPVPKSAPVSIAAPVPSKPVRQAVQQATGALGQVVAGTGSAAGPAVQQTTSAAAGVVQPVSHPVAGIVNGAGSGAAQTVTGVTQTIAGALSGVGGH